MVWARLDDQYPRSRKLLAAGAEGLALDVAGMCWAAAERTDGHIPAYALPALYPVRQPRKTAAKLVEVGRWHTPGHDCTDCPPITDGWYIHHYLTYNPSAEEAEAKSRARAEAGRQGGRRSGRTRSNHASKREANASTDTKQTPKQTPKQEPKQKRTPTPTPFASSEAKVSDGADKRRKPTAQTLIGEYVDDCATTPPKRHLGQLSQQVKALLDEGYDAARIRPALHRLRAKGLHPSTLPSVLNQVLNAAPETTLDDRSNSHLRDAPPEAWLEQR